MWLPKGDPCKGAVMPERTQLFEVGKKLTRIEAVFPLLSRAAAGILPDPSRLALGSS